MPSLKEAQHLGRHRYVTSVLVGELLQDADDKRISMFFSSLQQLEPLPWRSRCFSIFSIFCRLFRCPFSQILLELLCIFPHASLLWKLLLSNLMKKKLYLQVFLRAAQVYDVQRLKPSQVHFLLKNLAAQNRQQETLECARKWLAKDANDSQVREYLWKAAIELSEPH